MNHFFSLLLCAILLTAPSAYAEQPGEHSGGPENCRNHKGRMDCDAAPAWRKSGEGFCSSEMRGRCGKQRGDWYGASQPVANSEEARGLLLTFFSGKEYHVSAITERKWGFKADILDKNGTVVDRVMIDKRTGRIRSLD